VLGCSWAKAGWFASRENCLTLVLLAKMAGRECKVAV